MKKLLLLTITLFSIQLNAQNTFRLDKPSKAKIKKISPETLNTILFVEIALQKNATKLKEGSTEIYNPYVGSIKSAYKTNRLADKKIKKIDAIICFECYQKEWNSQEYEISKIKQIETKKKDNIKEIEKQQFITELKRKEKTKIKSVTKAKYVHNENINPYDKLQRSLYAFSNGNRHLTVFRKTDYNFSSPSLSMYLQTRMRLASKDFKYGKTQISETFIPKASKDSEYIKVTYFIENKTDIIGYVPSDYVSIINSVEIVGTPDLIVNLFLNYWSGKIKLKGYKKGVIASKELLSDFISIVGVTPSRYKITITKGNMDVNYKTTYGINQPK